MFSLILCKSKKKESHISSLVKLSQKSNWHHSNQDINAEILTALGPEGVLVNIARGSLVDTEALAVALRDNVIAAAAIDVYESEPKPPLALLEFENAIITPHVAGLSPEAMLASVVCFIDNVNLHLAGKPLRTPL